MMSSGGGNTHWCYQCRLPVCLRGRDMACPRCDGGFVHELEELNGGDGGGGGSGYGSYGNRDSNGPDQLMGIMDALDSIVSSSRPEHRYGLMEALDTLMTQRRRYGVESETRANNVDNIFAFLEALDDFGSRRRRRYGVDSDHPNPLLIFRGQMNGREPRGLELLLNRRAGVGFSRGANEDLFIGPGLQELMEQLMTDRQGPPPAPRSAIDAMPTVKITRVHLQTDCHCPVCKDQFEMGTEARQMPCNHIYHSDCIIPWLVQHNSCPVCRHVLGSTPPNRAQNPSTENRSSSSNSRGGRESSDQSSGRRNPFSFLWPFRSSSTSSGGSPAATTPAAAAAATTTTTNPHAENHEMNYSRWRFDF